MVDRAYKEDLPRLRHALERLREDFSNLVPTKTDWAGMRIEPLLKHLEALEEISHSRRFSSEFSRLRRGVELFHSDLVYFRSNVRGLERLLQSEKTHGEVKTRTA